MISFLLTLAFGLWLSRAGKPYNGLLFNLHKLIALGTVIALAVQIYRALGSAQVSAALVALIVLAGLCVVALFATGALMSIGKPAQALLLRIHNVAPVLGVVALAGCLYLLAGARP